MKYTVIVFFAALVAILVSCGTPSPTPPNPSCTPVAKADAGKDMYIVLGWPGMPTEVEIGSASVDGQTCSWDPADTLSDAKVCQPTAAPKFTTQYTLKVENKCGVAQDSVTVHVYSEDGSERMNSWSISESWFL